MDQTALITAVGRRMIQRKDVKAKQMTNGDGYFPVRTKTNGVEEYLPFTMQDLQNHFSGAETYGHYLLDQNSNCKFFAFDCDLEKSGFWGSVTTDPVDGFLAQEFNPREAWRDRTHPSRPFLKWQMRNLAGLLAGKITQLLQIPVAAAYTGNKGIHVYGFTGECPAGEAREGAHLVLAALGDWQLSRGQVFWSNTNEDPQFGFQNFSLEVFPKQDSLDGKDLGNLMRLPLGKNLKSPGDPTFFIDLRTDLATLAPHPDPVALLESGDAWS